MPLSVLLFRVICVFCLLVVLVRLSVPVQVSDWKDSCMTYNVLMGTLNPTRSLTRLRCVEQQLKKSIFSSHLKLLLLKSWRLSGKEFHTIEPVTGKARRPKVLSQ